MTTSLKIDALREELKRVDLVGIEAAGEERRDGTVVAEVIVRSHLP